MTWSKQSSGKCMTATAANQLGQLTSAPRSCDAHTHTKKKQQQQIAKQPSWRFFRMDVVRMKGRVFGGAEVTFLGPSADPHAGDLEAAVEVPW